MRLILDSALFDEQSEAEATSLEDLLMTVARDRVHHALLTDPPYQQGAANGPIDVWLDRNRPPLASVFRRMLADGPLVSANLPHGGGASDSMSPRRWHLAGTLTVRVERRTECDWQRRLLTSSEAADLLREPVHLVLENDRTEPAFLRHLAGPTKGETLRSLMAQPGRIAIHGGGNGAVKQWIETLATGSLTSEKWRQMLRAWVLFDHDAEDSDASKPSQNAVNLIEACEGVIAKFGSGLSWVCLCRREIESYVPDSGLLAQRAEKTAFVNQIIAWRKEKEFAPLAWSLNLKKGLLGDLLPEWLGGPSDIDRKAITGRTVVLDAHMLKPPFSGLSATEISALADGLGDAIGRALRAENASAWMSDFPAEYDRGPGGPGGQPDRDLFVQSLFDRM